MSEQSIVGLNGLADGALGHSSRAGRWSLRSGTHWELALASIMVATAVIAVWITLRADFLAYPGWLAVQKADFILGPIGVGLYWQHRRPGNRLGVLLILLSLLGIVYVGSSIRASLPFGIGVYVEIPIVLLIERRSSRFPADGSARWSDGSWPFGRSHFSQAAPRSG